MTIIEEYNKSEKIKIFRALVSSPLALIILKKYLNNKLSETQNKSVHVLHKTLSKTINNNHQILNLKDKYFLFSDIKKKPKILFSDNEINNEEEIDKDKEKDKERKTGRNKLASLNINYNLRISKNPYKIQEYQANTNKNIFIKTGLTYHNNRNTNSNRNYLEKKINVRTHSSRENINLKENLRNSKMRKNQKKSAVHILVNNIKLSKEKERSNANIHRNKYFLSEKKTNENNLNSNIVNYKSNNNLNSNSKYLLNKHMIIESKDKNDLDDIKKNNNENNLNVILDKNRYNFNSKINLQLKFKDNVANRINHLKRKDRHNLIQEAFNNDDF